MVHSMADLDGFRAACGGSLEMQQGNAWRLDPGGDVHFPPTSAAPQAAQEVVEEQERSGGSQGAPAEDALEDAVLASFGTAKRKRSAATVRELPVHENFHIFDLGVTLNAMESAEIDTGKPAPLQKARHQKVRQVACRGRQTWPLAGMFVHQPCISEREARMEVPSQVGLDVLQVC